MWRYRMNWTGAEARSQGRSGKVRRAHVQSKGVASHMRRLPRCGPSAPVRRPPVVTRPFASIPGRDWRSLAYHPGAQVRHYHARSVLSGRLQWKPRIDERLALWLAKQKRSMNSDGLPIPESELLRGSRRAFYVVSELMNPMLEKKDLPGDDQLRMLFSNIMVRWFHEYRAEYSREALLARKEEQEKAQEEEDDEFEDMLPIEEDVPVLWQSKHEVMNTELLRWDENQGIIKFTTSARYPHPVSGRMLFDHVRRPARLTALGRHSRAGQLWLFKYAVPRGATSNDKHFLLHEIIYPEL